MYFRKSLRLKDWDYGSEAAYFLTLLVKNRKCLFGEIRNGQMYLNKFGEIVKKELLKTSDIRNNVILDEFIIMPDHIHIILIITENLNSKKK